MRNSIRIYVLASITWAVSLSCKKSLDYYALPTFKNGSLQAVVEIPAGTNLKTEYDLKTNKFLPDQRDGKDRIIEFLGYPGNYGFIPSTYSDPDKGGDGDALDILVLGESARTGSVLQVLPIAVLQLLDEGELDYKIIAVPLLEKERIIKAATFREFTEKYPEAQQIIALWFTKYDPDEDIFLKGWADEKQAMSEIRRWAKP